MLSRFFNRREYFYYCKFSMLILDIVPCRRIFDSGFSSGRITALRSYDPCLMLSPFQS